MELIDSEYRQRNKYTDIQSLLVDSKRIKEERRKEKLKDRAQGMHKLTQFYNDISHEEIEDVFNRIESEDEVPSQIVAEEAAFNYGSLDMGLDEAIRTAKNEYQQI